MDIWTRWTNDEMEVSMRHMRGKRRNKIMQYHKKQGRRFYSSTNVFCKNKLQVRLYAKYWRYNGVVQNTAIAAPKIVYSFIKHVFKQHKKTLYWVQTNENYGHTIKTISKVNCFEKVDDVMPKDE